MRLWSLQPAEVVRQIEERGFAIARPDFDRLWGQDSASPWGFRQAYGWMSSQMALRLGPPPPGAAYPMWAWARPPAATRRGAPDLRSMRESQPGSLLELEVDPRRALLSDHGSWHHVLNGWPLALSEPLSDQLEARLRSLCALLGAPLDPRGRLEARHLALPQVQGLLGQGWSHIFRVEPLLDGSPARLDMGFDGDPQWMGGDGISVQACLWSIERTQIVSTTAYAARNPGFASP